jgi:hypothetical protein
MQKMAGAGLYEVQIPVLILVRLGTAWDFEEGRRSNGL